MHVAHNVFTEPCLDSIDDVLLIHIAVDEVVLAGKRLDLRDPRQNGVVLAIDSPAAHHRVVLSGAFQEAPRGDVELQRIRPGL